MNVLVATPVRVGTPHIFYGISQRIYNDLTWQPRERALFYNDAPGERFVRHGRARNELIELFLNNEHTHVLWLDVDLMTVPPDLIEKLVEIGEEHIVAPFVYLQGAMKGDYPIFYDVAAFVKDGVPFTHHAPYCRGPRVMELDSVGTCYLIPAGVYREGARYEGTRDEVEHISLMKQAREMGYKVFARRDVGVYHANIPAMSLDWHKEERLRPSR